jgi:DNA-binding SARP family transcriptional activator
VVDPEHRFAPDYYVAADRSGVWLDLSHVAVDLERFFERAEAALALHGAGNGDAARSALAEAESMYAGEFLEEDRYEDWAIPVRDEAASLYGDVLRALADAVGGHAATRYLRRLLTLDPYDEDAHLRLVTGLAAQGRHGDARHAYRRYVERLGEIGVEPAPYPARQGQTPAR